MWHGHTVSVILPTYNEKDSIRQFVLDVRSTGVVDEVLVVNNNAAAGTSEAIADTGAREIHESRQGYGWSIRRGLAESSADYLIVCEPDGTFFAGDVFKLLSYAEDFDVVYGSRTSQQLIWSGANMGIFLRWGNWCVAKYMQFLYNATSLTDVGCTMRLIRKPVATTLLPAFKIGGSEFGPEMMIESLFHGFRIIQIPVNYAPRVGTSSVTGDPVKAFFLGLRMIRLITISRLKRGLFSVPRVPRREVEDGRAR
jgi:glycosyltransferase involved in cell wall biosynthesis